MNSPSQSHNFDDDEQSQENIKKDYSAIVEQKRQELHDKKESIRAIKERNNELLGKFTRQLSDKQINPDKIEEFKKLNDQLLRAQKNLSLYQRNIKEYSWMFRNLSYNLQLEFMSKQEFISNIEAQVDYLTNKASHKDLIDRNTFKELLDNQIFDKMLSINDDRLRNYYYSKISEIFFINSERKFIKKSEFMKRWAHLLPIYEDYKNDEEFLQLREDFKLELSNPNSKYKASILNKIKDFIGILSRREYIDDILLSRILNNTNNKKIRDVIVLDIFILSNKDCKKMSFKIFKKLVKNLNLHNMVSLPTEFNIEMRPEDRNTVYQDKKNQELKLSDLYYSNLFCGSIAEEDEKEQSSNDHETSINRKQTTFDWSPGVSFKPIHWDSKDNYNSSVFEDDLMRKTEEEIILNEQNE